MTDQQIVGIDIGGAHLKYADVSGETHSHFFAMWKEHEHLAERLKCTLETKFSDANVIAITMTGELADCFVDRAEGVSCIVDAATQAARALRIDQVLFYQIDGCFVDSKRAKQWVDLVAASNWHASATWIARLLPSSCPRAMVIDIGSTTTDIIPISSGGVMTMAKTDFDRLAEGSLVYLGSSRTPICAIIDKVDFGSQTVRVMNECFATTDDVWLLLGMTDADPNDRQTADGRPRTKKMAANRIARMIGLDHRGVSIAEAERIARQVFDKIQTQIHEAFLKLDNGGPVISIGHGARKSAWIDSVTDDRPRRDQLMGESLTENLARVFPAYAVCRLLQG